MPQQLHVGAAIPLRLLPCATQRLPGRGQDLLPLVELPVLLEDALPHCSQLELEVVHPGAGRREACLGGLQLQQLTAPRFLRESEAGEGHR